MLEIAADRRAEHEAVDPDLAGLLLGDGAGAEPGAERPQRGGAVEAAQVVALAAAAIVENRLAAVGVANRAQSRGDLGDGGVPVDRLEGPVGSLAQRMEDPLPAAVLVVVEAERLLARVAPGRRVRLVPADLLEATAVVAAEPDQDPAVALAQDAGARLPLGPTVGLGGGIHLASPW